MDWPVTRKEAQRLGRTHYFTGVPCKRGHVALRKTKGNCVECTKEDSKAAVGTRKDYFKEWNKSEAGQKVKQKYYEANRIAVIERAKSRAPATIQLYRVAYKKKNPLETKADTNMYRRRLRNSQPPWLTLEQKDTMRAIYRSAAELTKATGTSYHVDHIVPIRSDIVCGLHVPWNLAVIPAAKNISKGNKHEP